MATVVALSVVLVWRVWNDQERVVVDARDFSDLLFDWRCEAGHSFKAPGQTDPLRCLTCNRPAHPVATYRCDEHGIVELLVRFAPDETGETWISQVKHPNLDWMDVESGLKCPKCQQELIRYIPDPIPPTAHDTPRTSD